MQDGIKILCKNDYPEGWKLPGLAAQPSYNTTHFKFVSSAPLNSWVESRRNLMPSTLELEAFVSEHQEDIIRYVCNLHRMHEPRGTTEQCEREA